MTQQSNFSATRPLITGILALCVLVFGFGVWAFATTLSGAIIARGLVEVDHNRQIVQHPDGGVVAELLVDEGDIVTKGQALIRLDDTLLASELAVIETQLFEILARRARLEAERDDAPNLSFAQELITVAVSNPDVANLMQGQRSLFTARATSLVTEVEKLNEQKGQIAAQVLGLSAQQDAVGQQLYLLRKELADQQTLLDKGLAQASRLLALQRSEADLLGRAGELTSAQAEAQRKITGIELTILSLSTQRREAAISELRDLQLNERALSEQRRALVERLSRLEITSPVSGAVYGLTIFGTQSVVRPADPLLYIVPQDRPLIVSARVDAIHVDQIYRGQPVILRLAAFDQRTTPELNGEITQISADVFQDEATRLSYYRAEIILSPGELARLPIGKPLIPGMPVEAFMRTEDRSPIAYLMQPLANYFIRAFRES